VIRRLFAALAVGVLTLAACSSTSSGSATPDPALVFCPALEAYGKSLTALDALTPTATVADFKADVTTAKTALAALIAVAGPYAGAQLTSLGQAQAQLEAAANELSPENNSPAEAESELSDELTAVIQQVALTNNAICNFRPTPSTSS
jgi:hypothetical protein